MTEHEVHFLNNSSLYEFFLYQGISKIGYIESNFQTRKYHIVNPRNQSEKYEVKLEQIVDYKELSNTSTAVKVASYALPTGSNRSKKAIILGAGASFDFTYDNNSRRMPLTKDLFRSEYNPILNKYQGAFDLSSDILQYSDIEDYFQRQWAKIMKTYNTPLLRQLISTQYYIHDLFFTLSRELANTQKNNYLKLVSLANEYILETHEAIIPIISFNYDTLIEEALIRQLGYYFSSTDDYVNFTNRNIMLFKPHGSCNWARKFKGTEIIGRPGQIKEIPELAAKIYSENRNLHDIYKNINEEIVIVTGKENNIRAEHLFYPALLIPYRDKDEFSMPSMHTNILRHMLSSVDEFLVIGWKGTEEHFRVMLKQKVAGRAVKFTLIEPSKPAADKFIADYKEMLPNAEFCHLTDAHGSGLTFTNYINLVSNNDTHFFST